VPWLIGKLIHILVAVAYIRSLHVLHSPLANKQDRWDEKKEITEAAEFYIRDTKLTVAINSWSRDSHLILTAMQRDVETVLLK
jgi:hypothetical protein